MYCYNITHSTAHDYCPIELVFEKIPPVLDFTKDLNIAPLYNIDSYKKEVKFRLQVASFVENAKLSRQKVSNDNANPVDFSLNDLVLLKNKAGYKLDSISKGPFRVTEIQTNNNIRIENDNVKTDLVHKNRLKKFV